MKKQGEQKGAGSEGQAREARVARVVCHMGVCHMVCQCHMVGLVCHMECHKGKPESKADSQTPSSRPSTWV